jgi:hypothetical protein
MTLAVMSFPLKETKICGFQWNAAIKPIASCDDAIVAGQLILNEANLWQSARRQHVRFCSISKRYRNTVAQFGRCKFQYRFLESVGRAFVANFGYRFHESVGRGFCSEFQYRFRESVCVTFITQLGGWKGWPLSFVDHLSVCFVCHH